jgi:hypothetical protein
MKPILGVRIQKIPARGEARTGESVPMP